RPYEVATGELKILATGTGEPLGSLTVKLFAELAAPSRVERQDCVVKMTGVSSALAPRGDGAVARAVRASVELAAPVSNREVATWFGQLFQTCVADALQISPQRIELLGVEGCTLAFALHPQAERGAASRRAEAEASPEAAMEEFFQQMSSRASPLSYSELAPFLPMAQVSQESLGPPPPFLPPAGRPAALPESPGLGALEEVLSGVLDRLFEVISASGVDPAMAFAVLDRDQNGVIAVAEMVALLQHLGLPLSQEVLALPSESFLDWNDFMRSFHAWHQRHAQPPPPGFGASPEEMHERCLLPDFWMFAILQECQSGRIPSDGPRPAERG
ncbi:Hypothetical protein SCF082_LOCUS50501, partial [Durusdinium trenchii]